MWFSLLLPPALPPVREFVEVGFASGPAEEPSGVSVSPSSLPALVLPPRGTGRVAQSSPAPHAVPCLALRGSIALVVCPSISPPPLNEALFTSLTTFTMFSLYLISHVP